MSHDASTTGSHHYAHHFESADHEFETSKFGMWVFLVTEIMLFGGLFIAYGIYRGMYPEMFMEAHHALNKIMGAVNTVVLICSSLTMALAVGMAQRNERAKSAKLMMATLFFACMFLVIKYFEYSHKIHIGLLPGAFYNNPDITHPKAPIFFSIYFLMTGLHGLHVLIGMGLIIWVLRRTMKGEFSSAYYTPVEIAGLYWHLVDLIWIYLFPLLYLIG
ncbi:MAG TPA: cytochrome c oxidase subunit 3 family protein [Oligoflexia bacterium]|nr:cytochrome c oxidase subunit 3 family protein [Oligoflexia bacterium]